MLVIIACRTLSPWYLLYVRISQWPLPLAEGSRLLLNTNAISSPVQEVWAVSDALSPGWKPTTALMIFHFLSSLLRLLNKVHIGSVQQENWTPAFLCKCVLKCQESLGTLRPPGRMVGCLAFGEGLWKWADSRGSGCSLQSSLLGGSRYPPGGSQQHLACLPGSNGAERPNLKSHKLGFEVQFCHFLAVWHKASDLPSLS